MGVQSEPNVANVFNGPAKIWIAPYPTAFPSLAVQPQDSDWQTAGFKQMGYTESGMDLTVTPATKDVNADEAITPIKTLITGIKAEAKTTLLEPTLENIERAMSMSKLTNPGTGIKTLKVGSANSIQEFSLGMQGAGPGGPAATVFRMFRCNSIAAVTMSWKRADVAKLAATFNALADSTQSSLDDICDTTYFNAGS